MVVLICFYSLHYALNRGQNERKLYYSTRLFRKCFVNSVTMRNFSLVARYSLKFTRCSLLIVKSLVTRCKICSSLVAEVAHCQKSLVTRCEIRLLLVAEVAHCKKSLETKKKIK